MVSQFSREPVGDVAAETHVKSAEDLRGGLENLNNFSLLSELAPTVESIM
jgi:hypothetical protein